MAKENLKEVCPTVLLQDAPAKKDEFGSHDRVVNAIAEILQTESGGKTIGVEGVWGSGKSTVVNLLREKLSSSKNTAVITFDAWMHEGDPLKRSFLERIIGSCIERNWVNEEKWAQVLKGLAHREFTKTTTSTPRLTTEGVLLSISLVLIPIGTTIFNAGFSEVGVAGRDPDLLVGLGGLCIISPLMLTVVLGLVGLFRRRPWDNLFRLLANKNVTEEKTINTEDPEPTSVEFTGHFSRLMTEALEDDQRRIVIIVDNLDRIPSAYGRTIWSALRTFLEHSESDVPPWFARLWLIVPYAHQSIATGAINADEDQEKLSAFLDKVFQVRFYLSAPVLSDWKGYLTRHLKRAFPAHGADHEFQQVFDAINFRLSEKEREAGPISFAGSEVDTPTPRELLLLINDIGALHRQWQHAVPLAHMAYYALLRREGSDIYQLLVTEKVPTAAEIEHFGVELAYNTAALYFNRDVETAQQILLKRPIEGYLSTGDGAGLSEFAKRRPQLFTVLQGDLRAILTNWASAPNTNKVAHAAECLLQSDVLTAADAAEAREIKSSLLRGAKAISQWDPLTAQVCSGITRIVRESKDKEFAEKERHALRNGYAIDSANLTPEAEKLRTEILSKFVDFLKECKSFNLLESLGNQDVIPGGAHEWIIAAQHFNDSDEKRDLSSAVNLNCAAPQFVAEYVLTINKGSATENHAIALRLAMPKNASLRLDTVGEAIQSRISSQQDIPGAELGALIFLLQMARKAQFNSMTALNNLANQGVMQHQFSKVMQRSEFEIAALVAFCILQSRPDIGVSSAFSDSQDGINRLNAILTNPTSQPKFLDAFCQMFLTDNEACDFAFLLNLWKTAPQTRKLVKAILLGLAKQGRLQGRLTPVNVLEMWIDLDLDELNAQKPPSTLVALIDGIDKDGSFTKFMMDKPVRPDNARLFHALCLANTVMSDELVVYIEKSLSELDKTIWIADMESVGHLGKFVRLLFDKATKARLKTNYLDGLVDYGRKVIKGNVTNAYAEGDWNAKLSMLYDSLRNRFKGMLLDTAIEMNGAVNDQFFDVFGKELADMDLLKNSKDVAGKLFATFVVNKNIKGLHWVTSIIAANNGGLEGFSDVDGIVEFKMRLTEAMRNVVGDAAEPHFKALFEVWTKNPPELPEVKPEGT